MGGIHLRLPAAGEAAQRGQAAADRVQAPRRAGQAVHRALPPPPPRRARQAASCLDDSTPQRLHASVPVREENAPAPWEAAQAALLRALLSLALPWAAAQMRRVVIILGSSGVVWERAESLLGTQPLVRALVMQPLPGSDAGQTHL